MLLDSASLYFRAFYGVPQDPDSTAAIPTNAIRGFIDMIATLVTNHRPTDLVACWDNDWRPAFRVDLIPTYKTHRLTEGSSTAEESPDDLTPQVPVIRQVLAAAGLARVGADGFEADDVIGTLSHRSTNPVDVVTGDRDLFQLVDDARGIRVLYTGKGGVRAPDLVDESCLQTRYDLASGRMYLDLSILRGDSSDGLPGVAGIGEKTGAKLLAQYGDLAGIQAAAADPASPLTKAQRQRILDGADYLAVAPTVVTVAPDAPVDAHDSALPGEPADPATLTDLVETYGLHSPVRRLGTALGWAV